MDSRPLKSGVFYFHRQLQEAAEEFSKKYIKRGQEGNHIEALQRGLNLIRKNWQLLDPDGKFGSKTYAALKACQRELNKIDIRRVRAEAKFSKSNISGYHWQRMFMNIKSDGIVGPVTLNLIDEVICSKGWDAWLKDEMGRIV